MQVATEHGFNPTVYAAEAAGLALASTSGFVENYALMGEAAFVQAVHLATWVDAGVVAGWVNNWTAFYSGIGSGAHPGLTVQQAAYGAAFGDAIGTALINQTPALLFTHIAERPDFLNFISGRVANALLLNAEGTLQTGVALDQQHSYQILQGGDFPPGSGILGIVPDAPHVV